MSDPTAILKRVEEIEALLRVDIRPSRTESRWLCSQLRSALQDTQRIDWLDGVKNPFLLPYLREGVWHYDAELQASFRAALDVAIAAAQASTREARP